MISIYKDFDNPPKDLLGDNPKITNAVKQALFDLYHGKCAFTEEKISFEEMQITHYRPVSLYPELEFEWSNLLPVSKEINTLLSNRFVIDGKKVDSKLLSIAENRKADSACLLAEKPLLLHPEVDTPENHFYFLDDTISAFTLKGRTTIELLELNNERLKSEQKKLSTTISNYINQLLEEVESKLVTENFDEYNQDSFPTPKLILKYLSLVKKYYEILTNLPSEKEAFSYFTYCCIERKLLGINNSTSISSSESEAHLKSSVKFLIYNCLRFIANAPSYIETKNKEVYELQFNDDAWKNTMSYALQAIDIKKYFSIKKITIKDIPLNTRWIFLTGENGHGKTLILQAIVLIFSGIEDVADDRTNIISKLKRPSIITRLSFPRNVDWRSISTGIFSQRNKIIDGTTEVVTSPLPKFTNYVAYGANRLELSGYVGVGSQSPQKVNKTDSLFTNNGTLYNIEEYLINIHGRLEFQDKFDAIKNILLKILPNIEDIIVDSSREKKKIFYQEKAEDGSLMPLISFHALSTGNKNLIAMVGDMMIELLLSNENINHPSELAGIVLIDEIDAHLHPKLQKQFIETLTRLFPKIQFIASTHSPIPLLGAPKETVILNVEKPSSKEGITIRRLDIDVTSLTPNTILTSPIFGFEGIISSTHNYEEPLYTGDTYNDVVFEQHLDKKLKEFAKNSKVNLDDLLNGTTDDKSK